MMSIQAVDTSLRSIKNPLSLSFPLEKTHKSQCYYDTKKVLKEGLDSIVSLNVNLISWDTFRLAVAAFPFFIASRMIEGHLQGHFYCKNHHKNRHQLHNICFQIADRGIGFPIILLGSYALYGRTQETRRAGRLFLTAMPFVIFGKDILKMLDFDFCKRPWHEKHSNKKRACGGFPSGHMAEAVYMASFFGMEYGPSHAIPLGIFAGFVGVTFINCNRHYLSQIVAGSVWGGMFAISSHKIMQKYSKKHALEFGFGLDERESSGSIIEL